MNRFQIFILIFFGFIYPDFSNAETLYFFPPSDSTKKEKVNWFEHQDTILLKPVCGSDGKTYINEEEANYYGVSEWTLGRCNSYNEIVAKTPNEAWITEVFLNDFAEKSSFEESGYSDFSNVIFEMYPSQKNILKYKTSGKNASKLKLKVWIDFDKDFEFEEEELIANGENTASEGAIEFEIPDYLEVDFITKMRVFLGDEQSRPGLGFINIGEVEDYTIMVGRASN